MLLDYDIAALIFSCLEDRYESHDITNGSSAPEGEKYYEILHRSKDFVDGLVQFSFLISAYLGTRGGCHIYWGCKPEYDVRPMRYDADLESRVPTEKPFVFYCRLLASDKVFIQKEENATLSRS